MKYPLLKAGNSKIDKSCLIFNLPTHVCGKECPGCYARKAEIRFPRVLESRNRNLAASMEDDFVNRIIDEIKASKKTKVRIHESGDFYRTGYKLKWAKIMGTLSDVKFYAYTKVYDHLTSKKDTYFAYINNFNLINSNTVTGLNYGDIKHVNKLMDLGYILCPCGTNNEIKCMKDCELCLTEDKICFIKH